MTPCRKICLGVLLLSTMPVWSQVENTPAAPVPAVVGPADISPETIVPETPSDQMITPPPVSGQSYPKSFTAEERSNYLRGGMAFTTAYTDNALGSIEGHPVSDVSYSLAPFITLDETTPRMHLVSTYAPGFTFYQRTSSRNEQDQNAAIDFQYRLSPHVTFSARDGFQKSSNVFNQPDLASAGSVSGGAEAANFSIISPIADRLSNTGTVGITSQLSLNSMIGASGSFTNLHYPDESQVPGLFDASSQAGAAFYTLRASKENYIGVTYQYQRLLSYPYGGENETQTHAVLVFYTLYPAKGFSLSLFGGPQYAEIGPQVFAAATAPLAASNSWNPAAGASFAWQGHLTSLALSYAHVITSGGGLIGAVKADTASTAVRQQLLRTLNASLSGGYAQNDVITGTPLFIQNGHTLSGTAALQQQLGRHLNLELGYTRLHQSYGSVAVLAAAPNTNREYVSLSYQFSKALGR